MNRQRDRYSLRYRVLQLSKFRTALSSSRFALESENGGRRVTIVTSSPITVTSGRRKCRSAVMAAIDAQSSIFPSSLRKCKSTRIDQTYVARVGTIVSVRSIGPHTASERRWEERLTFCPATIQRASRSTAFDFRRAFSSNLVITTSSSDCLLGRIRQFQNYATGMVLLSILLRLSSFDFCSILDVVPRRNAQRSDGCSVVEGEEVNLPSRFEI